MDTYTDVNKWLNLSDRPVFCVHHGTIIAANPAARNRFVPVNEEVEALLLTGQAEYAAFDHGCLYLNLRIGETEYAATVRQIGEYHIFILETDSVSSELRSLSLVAQELRTPLSNIMTLSDRLLPDLEDSASAAHLNKGLHQLLRIVSNISNAARYSVSKPNLAVQDIDGLLREQFERAAILCARNAIDVQYTGLTNPVYSLIDAEQLEQSLYQILSNAMDHTPPGGKIQAKLTHSGNTLLLSVQDNGTGLQVDPFDRFLREPSVTDPERGIGLGMRIIQTFATAHRGTVLLTTPEGGGLRLMLTLPIQLDITGLRSPTTHISYSGERDSGLIALSDSLPAELYQPNKE